MTDLAEYRAQIDAWWRRPLGRGGYAYWIAVYEENARRLAVEREVSA